MHDKKDETTNRHYTLLQRSWWKSNQSGGFCLTNLPKTFFFFLASSIPLSGVLVPKMVKSDCFFSHSPVEYIHCTSSLVQPTCQVFRMIFGRAYHTGINRLFFVCFREAKKWRKTNAGQTKQGLLMKQCPKTEMKMKQYENETKNAGQQRWAGEDQAAALGARREREEYDLPADEADIRRYLRGGQSQPCECCIRLW